MIRCDPPEEAVISKRLGPRIRSRAYRVRQRLKSLHLWAADVPHKLRDGLFRPKQISLSELRRGMEARNIGTRNSA